MIGSIHFILVAIAFGLTLVSGVTGRVPMWIPLLLVTIVLLMGGR